MSSTASSDTPTFGMLSVAATASWGNRASFGVSESTLTAMFTSQPQVNSVSLPDFPIGDVVSFVPGLWSDLRRNDAGYGSADRLAFSGMTGGF